MYQACTRTIGSGVRHELVVASMSASKVHLDDSDRSLVSR